MYMETIRGGVDLINCNALVYIVKSMETWEITASNLVPHFSVFKKKTAEDSIDCNM